MDFLGLQPPPRKAKCKSPPSEIKNNRINTWKYQRLFIWTRYCGKKVLLPPPMNLLDILVSLVVACYQRDALSEVRNQRKQACKKNYLSLDLEWFHLKLCHWQNKSRLAEICTARCHSQQTPVRTDDQDMAREKRYKKLIHSLATKYASLRDCRGKWRSMLLQACIKLNNKSYVNGKNLKIRGMYELRVRKPYVHSNSMLSGCQLDYILWASLAERFAIFT